MKKILTTLFMALGIYSLAQAQHKPKDEFGIGFGYNGAYLTADNSYQSTDAISGFNAQVYADHYFSRSWSLKVKVVYDQKGWANGYINTPTSTIDGVDFNLNYITVPVLANWHFGRTHNWYLDFGPYIGFLTSAHAAGYDLKDGFNSTDGGLAYGIGVKIPVSRKTKFFIEYDGQSSVVNVFNSGDVARNERFSFNVGLAF
ncbi:porin family protein [Mucilaginibacter sp. UR6-11]|uniref:porin family protein n=1 Tax=Mucilaginibacter sp. UR6-11 TaxID=1435644 RepID=UPI001E6466AC|nr:porin family protein [Mucilaginibacter sp. UR6-11]MCC8425695.1 PorT family protein [Mucilaginibacter sp. UR6-11]